MPTNQLCTISFWWSGAELPAAWTGSRTPGPDSPGRGRTCPPVHRAVNGVDHEGGWAAQPLAVAVRTEVFTGAWEHRVLTTLFSFPCGEGEGRSPNVNGRDWSLENMTELKT